MTDTLRHEMAKLLQEALDLPFTADPAEWERWNAAWRPRAEKLIAKTKTPTLIEAPQPFVGSPLHDLLKRAGGIITCGFHIFTTRQKSTGIWHNMVIFEDQDEGKFCYAFELSEDATVFMIERLIQGLHKIKIASAART